MQRHDLEPIVHDWLHHTLDTIPDPTHRYGLVASEVNETAQQRTWLPTPLGVQHTMWSTTKSIVAISIVALFGGILLLGVLTSQRVGQEMPASVAGFPDFPTGTFVSDDLTLVFRPDGTCVRDGVPCTFGIQGSLFSEVSFESSTGRQVPATYYWRFDGEQLEFELWGSDLRAERSDVYSGRAFTAVDETVPMPGLEADFPTGQFVAIDDSSTGLSFSENGRWRATSPAGGASGRYVVSGSLYTEAMHNVPSTVKVPATYEWRWDGERLRFVPWGDDADAWRRSFYVDHAYVRAEKPGGSLRSLLLSDPRIEYWVRVEISELVDGRYEAIASVDEELLGEGIGDTQQEAVKAALEPLGEPYASDMADGV